jgi:hypothetical protein
MPFFILIFIFQYIQLLHHTHPSPFTKDPHNLLIASKLSGTTSSDNSHLYSLAETPQHTPPPPIWTRIRGRYWSAKSRRQTTSLCNPPGWRSWSLLVCAQCILYTLYQTKPDLNGLAEHGDDEAAVDEVFSSVHISQSDVVVVFPPAHVTHLPRQFYAIYKGTVTREIFT